jgi:hypothetical protein
MAGWSWLSGEAKVVRLARPQQAQQFSGEAA